MRNHDDPSVEDILDSIKKVIARDSQSMPSPPDARAQAQAAGPVMDLPGNTGDELVLGETAPRRAQTDGVVGVEAGRVADTVRSALEQEVQPRGPAAQQGSQSGETSLEGMVREMLRPMLAQWLDRNLPGMVETLVKAEITRITGKKR